VVAVNLNSQGGEQAVSEIAAAGGRGVSAYRCVQRARDQIGRRTRGQRVWMGSTLCSTTPAWSAQWADRGRERGGLGSHPRCAAALGGFRSQVRGRADAQSRRRLHHFDLVHRLIPSIGLRPSYAAAKAVISLTRAAALQVGPDHIRVNCMSWRYQYTDLGTAPDFRIPGGRAGCSIMPRRFRESGVPRTSPRWSCSSPATNQKWVTG
jgi:NAD(P)-dependent dehydrogenase (short-subunit alcohol dehydrogenase family)